MSANTCEEPVVPGFIVLHGNRSEDLIETVISWLVQHPLSPLEEEVILAQSSGMGEWVKMELAQQTGVCSSVRVELPGRFLWGVYRQVLGKSAVPSESPLDKLPLAWRLMNLLPALLEQPVFAPVARYLGPDPLANITSDSSRLLQLTTTLADLFDQYQNHRADWLQAWGQGQDGITNARGLTEALPDDQLWQPALWRAVLEALSPEQRSATRPALHRSVLGLLGSQGPFAGQLPRRVVAFGMSQLSSGTLETLAALARHSQVILAVPNPCRFYWGDIMEGRELFKSANRRHPQRGSAGQAAVALEEMHLHAHPLLAAWGRQGRDFVRLLDAFDDATTTSQSFPSIKIDLFDEQPEDDQTPLLTRIQQRIRDLEPLNVRHDDAPLLEGDRSIVFHIAHSPVRELEVLHDQLLALLAQPGLQPRDIVVMVPDVQVMAPAIRAVFGRYLRHDKRHIPYGISDLSAKSSSPLILALEWALRLPSNRCGLSELVDLLEVPAVAKRFGIDEEKLPLLVQWMTGAGIRWGLHAQHRKQMDLAHCGDQNTAWFGLKRMLLGYFTGTLNDVSAGAGRQTIEPYTEVGGLDAALAGSLAHLMRTLEQWWAHTQQAATPMEWLVRSRWLLDNLFQPVDEADHLAINALRDGLATWLRACDQAEFEGPIGLDILRHGWMGALQLPGLDQRFRAGGVTFCTLMPMRAIPFEVVCLLGMNDGDYPRRAPRNDFDLLGQPGMFRPGDRSRQHDDRQLMLEALLSARRTLYVSWTGFSVRDNSEQPPSVLVSQLRDYIAAAWGDAAVTERTTAHPLQPFSRRYFEHESSLTTFAREWRSAHDLQHRGDSGESSFIDSLSPDSGAVLDQERLVRFFRNPVKAFFRERLGVIYSSPEEEPGDTEAFDLDGLENHQIVQAQIRQWPAPTQAEDLDALITTRLDGLQRSGGLPMKGLGDLKRKELQGVLSLMARAWFDVGRDFPVSVERITVQHAHASVVVRDWVEHIYQNDAGERTWAVLEAGKLLSTSGRQVKPRPDKLLGVWVRSLLAASSGHSLQGRVVGQDGQLLVRPLEQQKAREALDMLVSVWLLGQQSPLPLPLKTGLAVAVSVAEAERQAGEEASLGGKAEAAYEGSGDTLSDQLAEVRDMCLARAFPDFESLCLASAADGQRLLELAPMVYGPMLEWAQDCVTAHPHAAV